MSSSKPVLLPLDRIRVGGEGVSKFKLLDETDPNSPALVGLGRLNFFVGPNNAGKSRLLRWLASDPSRQLTYRDPDGKAHEIFNDVRRFATDLRQKFPREIITQDSQTVLSEQYPRLPLVFNEADLQALSTGLREVADGRPQGFSRDQWAPNPFRERARKIADEWDELCQGLAWPRSQPTVYIPALRGGRRLGDSRTLAQWREVLLEKDLYAEQTYAEQLGLDGAARNQVAVATGYRLYPEVRKRLLGAHSEREQVAAYERLLGQWFFEGQSISLIPREEKTQLFVKVGKEEEQGLGSLGDGLAQLIILTFDAFFRTDPHLFFVEEPELFLHPGMVRTVCEFFLNETPHTFFVATHSNHLLDLVWDREDVRIFHVSKAPLPEGSNALPDIVVERASPSKEILDALGVRASSVFLANAVIWVEGVTDHLYLRDAVGRVLRERGRAELREGLHYMFAHYAGANIANWDFGFEEGNPGARVIAQRLTSASMVIADQDDPGEKGWRDGPLGRALSSEGRFLLTEGREIENELPPEVIWKVVLDYEGKDAKLPDIPPFTRDDYKMALLGPFLQDAVETNASDRKSHRRGSYHEKKSRSLADKKAFASKALVHLQSTEAPALKALAEKIATFILERNPKLGGP